MVLGAVEEVEAGGPARTRVRACHGTFDSVGNLDTVGAYPHNRIVARVFDAREVAVTILKGDRPPLFVGPYALVGHWVERLVGKRQQDGTVVLEQA